MSLATEHEIRNHYSSAVVAREYVQHRFKSEVHRLLHDRQAAAVQRIIDREKPERILEIAPGPGRLTRALRTDGRLTCLEFNEGMIREGQQACPPGAHWVRGNGFQLPFDAAFDLVYSFRFVRHFHRADRERLYAQIRRVLRPGGVFMMDAVNERLSRPLREANPAEYPVYDRLYCVEELRREMGAAGFAIEALAPVQKFASLQCWSQRIIGPRLGVLNRFVIRMLERLPRRDGLEWIVTCRRA